MITVIKTVLCFMVITILMYSYWSWDESLYQQRTTDNSLNEYKFFFSSYDAIQNVEHIRSGTYDTSPFNKTDLIAPFIRYRESFQVAPDFHLSSCLIEKVMTTINCAIFCYITNTSEFVASNRTISTERYETRFCKNQNYYENFSTVQEILGSSKTEYAIVRDPISRFLSGFVDKCIKEAKNYKQRCFGCNGDMSCFVEQLYHHMKLVQSGKFKTFQYELYHLTPQTWYCNFKEHLYNYTILRYKEGMNGVSELAHELDMVYEMAHVPEHIRLGINKELCVGRTSHTTSGTKELKKARDTLVNNKTLLTIVTRMYYYDFIIFDFALPALHV